MNILIIEDEQPAALRLKKLLLHARPHFTILEALDSVEDSVRWLQAPPEQPDLIFMDIQLADGLSFDIFKKTQVKTPVIFTTAYDQYSLRAFKVNSIDYLLKPVATEELEAALTKYEAFFTSSPRLQTPQLEKLINALTQPQYKERFLIKAGQEIRFIETADVAFFYSEDGLIFATQQNGHKHHIDHTLDQLEELLDPKFFFRINRKTILQLKFVNKIFTYFNSRLKLEVTPAAPFDLIVSRDRVSDFKKWLDK